MSDKKKLSIFLKGIIQENPVLILVLGTCPTLATTSSVISAFSMGIVATIVLVCSNLVISLLRNAIPNTVRIPCYIVIIASFVTAIQMIVHAYLPSVYDMLGVYLALVVVNCIILGRAEMFARKNPVGHSVLDGLGMGIGFLLALLIMGTIREVLGAGSFAGITIPVLEQFKIPILTQAPGGYLVFGIVIAVINAITAKRNMAKKNTFTCENCSLRGSCSMESCEGREEDASNV